MYAELAEALLNEPYHVIDIMPRRVPEERAAAWFASERVFLRPDRLADLYASFARMTVKVGCYYDAAVCAGGPDGGTDWMTPDPEELYEKIAGPAGTGYLLILFPGEHALITLNSGDLYMTAYHAGGEFLETVRQTASAEGLFLRPGEADDGIRGRTRAAEEKLARVFSERRPFSEHLSRWTDDELRDKYDHNAFEYRGQPTREEFRRAVDHQKARGDGFIKLEGDVPLQDAFGLEGGVTLTMVLSADPAGRKWKTNPDLRYARPSLDELECFEVKHYGPVYGENFTRRNIRREYEKLEYHGAYLDGVLVGACYTFSSDGMTCIDGLTVDESYRRRYIATSLLAHLAERYADDTLFLHADADDTPKDMYLKMGFETADRLYEYLSTDLKSLN